MGFVGRVTATQKIRKNISLESITNVSSHVQAFASLDAWDSDVIPVVVIDNVMTIGTLQLVSILDLNSLWAGRTRLGCPSHKCHVLHKVSVYQVIVPANSCGPQKSIDSDSKWLAMWISRPLTVRVDSCRNRTWIRKFTSPLQIFKWMMFMDFLFYPFTDKMIKSYEIMYGST